MSRVRTAVAIAMAAACVLCAEAQAREGGKTGSVTRAGVTVRATRPLSGVAASLVAATPATVDLHVRAQSRTVVLHGDAPVTVSLPLDSRLNCDLDVTVSRRHHRSAHIRLSVPVSGAAPSANSGPTPLPSTSPAATPAVATDAPLTATAEPASETPDPEISPRPAASSPSQQAVRWAPPALTNPVTVLPSDRKPTLTLDNNRDYFVQMPTVAMGRVTISGGHNVVLIGGHVSVTDPGPSKPSGQRQGLYLKGQTGTVHVEGLLLDGPGLGEGIDLDERLGATVQIENVKIGQIRARDEVDFSDTHPDLVQTWGGPRVLRIDRLTGSTDYQALFLHPTEYDKSAKISDAQLSNINVTTTNGSQRSFWQMTPFPLSLSNVWFLPPAGATKSMFYPSTDAWAGVVTGSPIGGDMVPAGVAGIGYRPAGYASS